jgi:hypothetical protein
MTRRVIVYYTGIGANKSGKHTVGSFVRKMRAFARNDPTFDQSRRTRFTLADWLAYSGAELVHLPKRV